MHRDMDITGAQENAGPREQFASVQAPIGLPWRVSVFAIVLFLFTLFTYAGLRFGYSTYLSSQEEDIDAELATLAQRVSTDEQEQFVTLYSQILNLKTALDSHTFTANVFPFLERNVVDGINFSSAEFSKKTSTVKLIGATAVFETLAGQMAVLEEAPEVLSVSLEKVNISSGNVTFTISVVFMPDTFVRQTF
jgi:hypothetical protein